MLIIKKLLTIINLFIDSMEYFQGQNEPDIIRNYCFKGIDFINRNLSRFCNFIHFDSVFIHQKPIVTFNMNGQSTRCELGDLLLVCVEKERNRYKNTRATIFQAKRFGNQLDETQKFLYEEVNEITLPQNLGNSKIKLPQLYYPRIKAFKYLILNEFDTHIINIFHIFHRLLYQNFYRFHCHFHRHCHCYYYFPLFLLYFILNLDGLHFSPRLINNGKWSELIMTLLSKTSKTVVKNKMRGNANNVSNFLTSVDSFGGGTTRLSNDNDFKENWSENGISTIFITINGKLIIERY